MLMVDEEKQELVFELALGEKGKDVSGASGSRSARASRAGWPRPASPRSSTTRHARPALRAASSTPRPSSRRARSCAPRSSRAGARSACVRDHQQARAARFTQADLELLLTLVEPCAIAIENAILFQRTEQLTITDDLTSSSTRAT